MTVAAGPGFVVEMVNLAESVWRTGGGMPQLVQTRDARGVLRQRRATGSPIRAIIYDAKSGRWFASISDVDAQERRARRLDERRPDRPVDT